MYNKSLHINDRIIKKNVYVFKESVVYPFVNFDIRKNFYFFPMFSTLECLNYKNKLHILIFSYNST